MPLKCQNRFFYTTAEKRIKRQQTKKSNWKNKIGCRNVFNTVFFTLQPKATDFVGFPAMYNVLQPKSRFRLDNLTSKKVEICSYSVLKFRWQIPHFGHTFVKLISRIDQTRIACMRFLCSIHSVWKCWFDNSEKPDK